MAIPVIASSTSTNTGGGTASLLTFTKPAGVANGDLLLLVVGGDADNSGTFQPTDTPTGWNLISSASGGADSDIAAFWRIADGTEGATLTITRNSLAGFDELYGWYLRITGADSTTPINQTGANSGLFDLAGVTTDTADCLAFGLLGGDGGDMFPYSTTSPGWTKFSDQRSGIDGSDASGVIFTKEMATAGDTGTLTVVATVSDGRYGFQFAVAPGSGGSSGITGSLGATYSPTYPASIGGSVGISGSLLAAHLPTYTLSGAGAVSLEAFMAASHFPAYATDAVGSVSVLGSLTAANSAAYAFSGSGSIGPAGIAGQIAATYSPDHSFSATGEVMVYGSLSATSDGYTAAVTGSVAIAGSMSANGSQAYTVSIIGYQGAPAISLPILGGVTLTGNVPASTIVGTPPRVEIEGRTSEITIFGAPSAPTLTAT